jgi:hypothetical protein
MEFFNPPANGERLRLITSNPAKVKSGALPSREKCGRSVQASG